MKKFSIEDVRNACFRILNLDETTNIRSPELIEWAAIKCFVENKEENEDILMIRKALKILNTKGFFDEEEFVL